MAMRDLIPSQRRPLETLQRDNENPLVSLHRELNRMFDEAFRGVSMSSFGSGSRFDPFDVSAAWPKLEVRENEREVRIKAELPGLDEKDVNVELANGVLSIKGEKKTEMQDDDRLFSEVSYGRFERRIPLEDVDEDKVNAQFKNGVLTLTMPKTARAMEQVKRIPINGN